MHQFEGSCKEPLDGFGFGLATQRPQGFSFRSGHVHPGIGVHLREEVLVFLTHTKPLGMVVGRLQAGVVQRVAGIFVLMPCSA